MNSFLLGLHRKTSIKELSNLALITFLTGLIIIAYYPALDNDFTHWDDQFYVTNNLLITHPTGASLSELTTKIVSLNYHPLTMMSLWLNSKLFGSDSAYSFIAVNIGIHIVNTWLVYILILRLFPKEIFLTFFTSCIFGLHPMHVESVAWVSERKDVLYGCFFILSLLAYLKSKKEISPTWICVSLLLFVASCLSKAMAVSLVPVLYLIDYINKDSFNNLRLHLIKTPYILIGLFFGVIAINVQSGGDFHGFLARSMTENAMESQSFTIWQKLNHLNFGIDFYIKKFFFPTGQSAFHPFSFVIKQVPHLGWFITPILFLAMMIWSFFKYRRIFFGLVFFLLTILLVLQLIPVGSAIVAERYTYIPYIGFGIVIGSILQLYWTKRMKIGLVLLTAFMSVSLVHLTRIQSNIWQNHTTLFKNVVKQYPKEPQPRQYLASGYWTIGMLDSAIYHAEYAINNLGFVDSKAFDLLANCYADKDEPKKAMAFYNKALELDNQNLFARYHRAILLMDIDPKEAITEFDICEQSGNVYITNMIYMPRGRCFGMVGDFELALKDQNTAIQRAPNNIENYLDRAVTFENLGRWDQAIADYKTALSIDPERSFAKNRLSQISKNVVSD